MVKGVSAASIVDGTTDTLMFVNRRGIGCRT